MALQFSALTLSSQELESRQALVRRLDSFLHSEFNPNSNLPSKFSLITDANSEALNRRITQEVITELQQEGWNVKIALESKDGWSTLEFGKVEDISKLLNQSEINLASKLEIQIDNALQENFWRADGLRYEFELPHRGTPRIVIAELERRYADAGWWVEFRPHISDKSDHLVFKKFAQANCASGVGK